jgi:hypothetical protein
MAGSITRLIKQLPDDLDEATNALWQRYQEECCQASARGVSAGMRRAVDADQIAVDAFYRFCQKVREGVGKFAAIQDRDAVWKLLREMIRRETWNQLRKETRYKRNSGQNVGESVFFDTPGGLAEQARDSETPDSIVMSSEQINHLFAELPQELRQIAQWKADGETNVSIARRLGCDPTNVKYRLDKIARIWTRMLE